MPTIKTIKPDGSGDFTTLQAWEDWADGEASAAQHAECYSGGDLGSLIMDTWASTPSTSNYRRVYPASGHRHTGAIGVSGVAYMGRISSTNGQGYQRFEGMYIRDSSGSLAIGVNGYETIVDSCFIEKTNASTSSGGIELSAVENVPCSGRITNNIVVTNNSATNTIGISVGCLSFSYASACDVFVANNVVAASFGTISKGFTYSRVSYGGLAANTTATFKNNIAIQCSNCYMAGSLGGAGTLSLTSTHNMSSDATGDDWGATGAQINVTYTSIFENYLNDFRIKAGSPAIDVGTDLSATFTTDFRGYTRTVTWDMGAHDRNGTAPAIAPVADFSASPTSGNTPLTVSFTDLSTNTPTSWAWDFGDGGVSTSQNPSHEYAAPGTYDVELVATNGAGSDSEIKLGYITVTAGKQLDLLGLNCSLHVGLLH